MTSSLPRAECRRTTSVSAPRAARDRSMLMIGVMPLPALTNRSFSGSACGSTNVPSTPPRRTIDPGRAARTRCDETLPASTSLGVMLMHPSGRSGSDVSEYARQWWIPSTTIPIAQVLPRFVARPLPAGTDQHRRRVRRLARDPLDPTTQLLRRPQRVDQLQVVVGQQRREERSHRTQQPQAPGRDARTGSLLSHDRPVVPGSRRRDSASRPVVACGGHPGGRPPRARRRSVSFASVARAGLAGARPGGGLRGSSRGSRRWHARARRPSGRRHGSCGRARRSGPARRGRRRPRRGRPGPRRRSARHSRPTARRRAAS